MIPVNAQDWPYWRGPNRNGISNEKDWNPEALNHKLKILWRTNVGEGYSSVTVKGNHVYTMGNKENKDRIYCLQADSGDEVWQFVYDCPVKSYPGSFSTPVIDQGFVYTLSRKGDVYCLYAETDQKKWSLNITRTFAAHPPKYGFSGSPVVEDEFGSSIFIDGYLYVPHGDTRHRTAYLKCVHFNTGDVMWTRDTGHCSIIHVDGKFIVLNQWGELTVMEASEDGYKDISKAKIVDTSNRIRCWTAPVLCNGKIYIRTNIGDLVCVDVSLKQAE